VNAPWHALTGAAICLGVCGVAGFAYTLVVIRHARRQTGYSPDVQDWRWYMVLPLVSYAALLVCALCLPSHGESSLFAVAGTAQALLFVGIHNAWDTVTYVAMNHKKRLK
jgi:hypothetical protein